MDVEGGKQSWPFRIFHKFFLCKIYILAISVTRKKKQYVCSRKHRNILCGAQRLRAHDALPEDQMSVSSTHVGCHTTVSRPLSQRPCQVSHNCLSPGLCPSAHVGCHITVCLQASDALFWLPWTSAHKLHHTCCIHTHTH